MRTLKFLTFLEVSGSGLQDRGASPAQTVAPVAPWSKSWAEQILRAPSALWDGSSDELRDKPGKSIAAWHKRRPRQQRKTAA